MKVLMAAPFDANGRYKGGIGSVVNTMLEHRDELDKNSLDIIKFNTCVVERPVGSDEKLGFANIKNTLILYKAIVKEVRNINPEVLYFHTSNRFALLKDLLIVRHAKRKTKVKTIAHIHAADFAHISIGIKPLDNLVIRFLKKYVDRIVFLSKRTKDDYVLRGLSDESCDVIYNYSTIPLDSSNSQKIYDGQSPIKLLFVGVILADKGFFDLTEVVCKLKDENIELHVCGEPYNKTFEKLFDEYKEKLGNKLIYHGFVSGDEKLSIYNDADVLILPSYGEGLPMVILEAYTAGCAVISTDVGAIPEILGEKNGIMITPGDKVALEEAILCYVNDTSKLVATQKENVNYAIGFTCDEFIRKTSYACKKAMG